MTVQPKRLAADRYLPPDPATRRIALGLYDLVAGLPIVSPHGHVDPRLLADPEATFGTPTELLIIPDHYVFRMLYSQGIPLEALGIRPRADAPGGPRDGRPATETDHRRAWQLFADHVHLFRATPSGAWLADELSGVFGIDEPLGSANAGAVYDAIEAQLARPEFRPRALFERFRIETLCTTDDAADPLDGHRAIRASGWSGDVRPTFRPDGVVNLLAPGWRARLDALSDAVGREISSTADLLAALEARRAYFREMGAVAADHGVETAYTSPLEPAEADAILARALRGVHVYTMKIDQEQDEALVAVQVDADCFATTEPVSAEFTRNLRPLLQRFGSDPRLRLILFTLDETAYSRELAPLAGHYPALRLGPPWWFHDSLNGIVRYLDRVVETAGIANLAGFNDDTRAFCSIPARHDAWRRATAGWLAGLVVRDVVDEAAAAEMAGELACGLARRAYRLDDAG